ncbi:MAG: ABC transporter permease [Acidimicrobiia bacterium]|nr:ABC transporter permease [Acidimicrobiia bacterium]MCY4432590.1 ABC transporter permease [bacterium]
MSSRGLRQLATQTRFDFVLLWRNPLASFFTVVLPLIFLFVLTALFGNELVTPVGPKLASRFVPGIIALSVVQASFVNLAMVTVIRRETSILKRVRGTPMRPWVFMGGLVATSYVVIALMAVLVVAIGWAVYDVSLLWETVPSLIVTLLIGGAVFCALGLAFTKVVPNETSAPPFINLVVLPLYFVSDVYVPASDDTPQAITVIGDIFPIRHLAVALQRGFDPLSDEPMWPVTNWLVMAAWGVVGVLVVIRWFRWTPKG